MGPSFEPSPRGLRRAWTFVVLLGVVSLLADMTYEGARSLLGPFLGALGAGAAVVGLTAGLGEFVGYALRLLTGALADRTRGYWALTLWGYGLNLLAVPALALVGRWETALGLVVLERLGKAIRTPARDALLSQATARMGHGRGFGLHETLDQIGAVLGPLLVAFVFFQTGSYRVTFGGLAVPALLALGALLGARRLFPSAAVPPSADELDPGRRQEGLPRTLWPYTAFVGLSALGFVSFPLIAFHLKATGVASETTIALLFALAMGTDALVAYPLGWLFDRWGMRALGVAPLFALPVAPLVFGGPIGLHVLGLLFWGGAMGAHETVLRAAIAAMIPSERRGTAYGIFHTVYGLAWLLGGTLMGLLYEQSLEALVGFSIGMELSALLLLGTLQRTSGGA